MKVVDKTSLKSGDQRQHALNEQAICEGFSTRMRHKNIVNVYEVLTDRDNIYIAMDFIEGGELFDRIKRAHHLDEPCARTWFREIVEAVYYIHEVNHTEGDPQTKGSCNFLLRTVSCIGTSNQKMVIEEIHRKKEYIHRLVNLIMHVTLCSSD